MRFCDPGRALRSNSSAYLRICASGVDCALCVYPQLMISNMREEILDAVRSTQYHGLAGLATPSSHQYWVHTAVYCAC